MSITVSRKDIDLEEHMMDVTEGYGANQVVYTASSYWEAQLNGPLSTGESVRIRRTGETHVQALGALEAAITKNGWEVR